MTGQAATVSVLAGPEPSGVPSAPRLGFVGVGWIGRARLASLIESGAGIAAAIADPEPSSLDAAAALAPEARVAQSFAELLDLDLDGVVLATPSALHADQAIRALERGLAVFCQKPLGRDLAENRRVVEAAARADRLLGVDFSYRYTAAARAVAETVAAGELGRVFAARLVFHNAYGPHKPWFYDSKLSGGGCAVDLGIHLVDLALWTLGFPRVEDVAAHRFAAGRLLADGDTAAEDFAAATLSLETGAAISIACSWKLHAGRDAVIEASFHGDRAGARLSNVGGSFYDFQAELFHGTRSERLAAPPDAWGGRALVDWSHRLAAGGRYDRAVARVLPVAEVIDRMSGRCVS